MRSTRRCGAGCSPPGSAPAYYRGFVDRASGLIPVELGARETVAVETETATAPVRKRHVNRWLAGATGALAAGAGVFAMALDARGDYHQAVFERDVAAALSATTATGPGRWVWAGPPWSRPASASGCGGAATDRSVVAWRPSSSEGPQMSDLPPGPSRHRPFPARSSSTCARWDPASSPCSPGWAQAMSSRPARPAATTATR